MDYYINTHFLKAYPTGDVYGHLDNCNDEKTECDLAVHVANVEDGSSISDETHKVKVVWQETDTKVKQMMDDYIEKIENIRPVGEENGLNIVYFGLTDLNKINYLNHIESTNIIDDMNKAVKYSEDLREIFGNSNVDYYLDMRAGAAAPMQELGFGGFILYYNGVIYGFVDNVGIEHKNIIYIPDETENTKEAYIAAAKKRIDEYLGNDSTKIEAAGLRSDYTDMDFSELGDESKMGDYYYNITVGDITQEFIIVRDSSKIEAPSYDTKDMKTNIRISSTSAEIPLDTSIKVEIIEEGTETFKNIVKTLNVETAQIYDLKLYSKSSAKFISKLSSGEFEVTVPIEDKLKGKELSAYYVTDKNEIEEHPVTIVNGMAKFTTTHFSIYTIAEKTATNTKVSEDELNEQVPNTFDGIMNYIIIGIVGFVGLSIAGFGLKKREN